MSPPSKPAMQVAVITRDTCMHACTYILCGSRLDFSKWDVQLVQHVLCSVHVKFAFHLQPKGTEHQRPVGIHVVVVGVSVKHVPGLTCIHTARKRTPVWGRTHVPDPTAQRLYGVAQLLAAFRCEPSGPTQWSKFVPVVCCVAWKRKKNKVTIARDRADRAVRWCTTQLLGETSTPELVCG